MKWNPWPVSLGINGRIGLEFAISLGNRRDFPVAKKFPVSDVAKV